ncbi:MAG TPA: hypothetical protein VNK04_06175 [Gemmataceae bacterium]|nr:hypothetical protein [Gemmataceae bacterium]
MKRARRLLLGTFLILVIGGILVAIVRLYLRSDRAMARAAARLEALYGGPVRLDRMDIGPGGSSLYGLQLFEPDSRPGDPPWITVREVETDITAFDLINGDTSPRTVTLIGVSVVLRFDRTNRLLTRLPRPRQGGVFPHVRIQDGRLIIRQEGRPDMVVTGVHAELLSHGGRLVVTGTVADPYWGDWDLAAAADPEGAGEINLKTAQAPITRDWLAALPFVSSHVWKQVQAEGGAPVECTLRLAPEMSRVRYRVVVLPRSAWVRVAPLDLEAEQVGGQVIIEDGLVQLRDLRGRAADGEIETAGDLDFRTVPPRLDLTVAVRGLDLRRLPESWSLTDLLEGRATGRARLAVVLAADGPRTNGEGHGMIADARVAGLDVHPIDLRLLPETDQAPSILEAVVTMEAEPAKLLAKLGTPSAMSVAGRLTLSMRAAFPLTTLRDRRTYRAAGMVTGDRLRIGGSPVEYIEARLTLDQGDLLIAGLRGSVEGMPIAGAAEVRLTAPYYYRARLDLRHGGLAVLHRLLPEWRPVLDIDGRFALTAGLRGTLRPFTLSAAGTGRISPLRWEELQIDKVQFRWDVDGQRLRVSSLSAALYGGRLSGVVEVPLASTQPGRAALAFEGLDLSTLARDVPGLPFDLEGRAGGTVEGTLGTASTGRPRDLSARIEVEAPRLRVQGLPTEDFRSTITYRKSEVAYRCEGQMLGGRFVLQGRLPSRGAGGAEGRLRMEAVRLTRLWPALGIREALERLGGEIDLEVDFRHEGPDGRPTGAGRFVLHRLRWGDRELASSLRGEVQLDGRQLRLSDLTANLGQGRLSAQVGLNLERPEQSWFNLGLENIEGAQLPIPWGAGEAWLQGPLDLRLRGTLGREWSGSGRLTLTRGRVLGVEVADLQAPVDFAFSPRLGHGQLNLREAGAQVALGRAVARATVSWGNGTRLEGQVRFLGVDLQALLRPADLGPVGGGRVSGRIDFAGSDVRSLDDLTASIEASFTQAQALDLPVLRQLLPYLVPGQTASPVFHSGQLRAHLAGGVVRVQRLALSGTLLQVLLEGTATLQGRIDLNVTADTGQPSPGPAGLRLPPGQVPLRVFRQASGLLANRLVRLRLSGTVRNPIIQVEPLPGLQ